MGLKKLVQKLSDYNSRLERGKAEKIEPDHVRKVLDKLRKKAAELEANIAATENPEKRDRLNKKQEVALQHVQRAEWLLKEVE